ncbi:hypothetical protein GRJ2_002674200 [Grus japonensis]|uniref:Uncharacterized protein n=1 Tax=Grus japonensis TaxID=30415 RepID=A0ABC9XXG2_GRUJA
MARPSLGGHRWPGTAANDGQDKPWRPSSPATTANDGQDEPWRPSSPATTANDGQDMTRQPFSLATMANHGQEEPRRPSSLATTANDGQDMTRRPFSPAVHGRRGSAAIFFHQPWPMPGRTWLGRHLYGVPIDPRVLGHLPGEDPESDAGGGWIQTPPPPALCSF